MISEELKTAIAEAGRLMDAVEATEFNSPAYWTAWKAYEPSYRRVCELEAARLAKESSNVDQDN